MNGTERTALNCDCLLSQGPQGPQGEQGPQGPLGVPGERGPKGDTGNDGKSAYQLAVEGGYTGTEEEFNQQLAGLSELAGDFLPKVFDGKQVISPKTAGTGNSIVFDSKDDRCKFEIRKTLTGFALYSYKKVNGLWQVVAEISSDVENLHKLRCSYNENGKICSIDVAEDGFKVDHFNDGEHADFKINCQTGATFNGKRILTEDDGGGSASIPAFPAPAEQTSSESYTESLGYHHFENKSISRITFQREPDNIFKTGVEDGTKTLSFKLGGIWDIILNFTVENGAVTYAILEAQKDGVSSGQFNFIEGGQYLTWDTNIWLDSFQIYFDSTKRAISADFDLKANDISALADFTDESLSFTLKESINPLPAASAYKNQLAYVYEEGEYSDIKNLIYSDGASWQFLPGAVLQIPDERMKAASILETPAYCGIELKTGQFAIPARNKNDMAPYYNVGQMHEFYLQADNPLNRYWSALSFGTQFIQTMNELAQTSDEDAVWLCPQNYTETTFVNKSETIHTQNIKLFLTSQYSYCNFIFCQGTNKIKLTFQEKQEGTKIFYNGKDITEQSELMLDTDAKTIIGKVYANNYNDCILELYDLPYSAGGSGGSASGDTPAVDLGQVTSASFEVNKNYSASVSGSASFTLPTPADTTIANKITVNLTVLSAANIDWGANVNAALAEFEPGKYQIRLLWNNTSSAWSAEVLKETKAESNVKTFISFNGNYSDECGTVSLTLNNSPSYSPGPFENHKSLAVSRSDSPLTMSGDLTKWNFGLNPFKITCWVLNSNNSYFDIFSSSDASTRVNTMGQCTANGVTLSPTTTSVNIAAWTFLEFGRGSDGIFRFFADGVQKMQKDASTLEADFSNASRMFSNYGSASTAYMSDFVISAESVSQADYTRPTMPFVLADSGVSDLHDDKKENISNKTSDYTAAGTGTYPSSKALSDAVSYLEGLISAATPPTPDYTNAAEFSKGANTNYTCPAAGWIQIRSAVFTAAAGSAGYAKISINGKDIRDYYVSNSSATTYTWSNNAGSNFAGETLIDVAKGDNVKFYADGFTMSNATFEGTFVPQAA